MSSPTRQQSTSPTTTSKSHSRQTRILPLDGFFCWMKWSISPRSQAESRPLGLGGEKMLPTSSVRTLCHPETKWFAKFLIDVRLTNCVRKNAWCELDSAVQLSSTLHPMKESEQLHNLVFKAMMEPFATTINLESVDPQQKENVTKARESFGVLCRENLSLCEIDVLEPTLAGALFACDRNQWNYGWGTKAVQTPVSLGMTHSTRCFHKTSGALFGPQLLVSSRFLRQMC